MSLRNQAVSGVKWNTLNNIVLVTVGVLRLAILTRLLDKSDFGLIAIASTVIDFTTIFSDLGLTSAVIHKQGITDKQYSSIFWINMIMGVGISLLICLLAPVFSVFYSEEILNIIIPLLGLQVFFTAFGKMFQTIKTKELDFAFISKVSIFISLSSLVVTTIMAILNCGVYSLVFGQLFSVVVTQFIYFINGLKRQRILLYCSIGDIRDMIKIGGYQLGSQILDFMSARIDIFIMGKFFSMGDLGLYNIAKNLVSMPYQIINSLVSSVGMSAFAKIQDNEEKVKLEYSKIVTTISSVNMPIYVLLFAFALPIVQILYAPEFVDVNIYLRILAPWGFLASANSLIGMVLIAKGRTDLGFTWTWVRLLMSALAVYIACQVSVLAIAYSQAIVGVISFFVYYYMVVSKVVSVQFLEYMRWLKRPIFYSLLSVILPYSLYVIVPDNIFTSIAFMILYATLYILLQWCLNKDFVLENLKLILRK